LVGKEDGEDGEDRVEGGEEGDQGEEEGEEEGRRGVILFSPEERLKEVGMFWMEQYPIQSLLSKLSYVILLEMSQDVFSCMSGGGRES
jgi:hypothetical protein